MCECSLEVFLDCVESFVWMWRCPAVFLKKAAKIRDEIRKLESTELEITLNPKIRQYDVKNKLYPKGRSTMGMPGTKVTKKKDKKWKHAK